MDDCNLRVAVGLMLMMAIPAGPGLGEDEDEDGEGVLMTTAASPNSLGAGRPGGLPSSSITSMLAQHALWLKVEKE